MTTKQTHKRNRKSGADSPGTTKNRVAVPEWIQLRLWVKSGGRCEFNGCNADVYTEKLTLKKQKLAEIAHIVAAEPGGPRGDDPLPLDERNNFENLMLVCGDHHKLFDRQYVKDYPVELLRKWKREHERRVESLLSITTLAKTMVIRLRGKIGTEMASCGEKLIRDAILPKYPLTDEGIEIDLRSIPETGNEVYWNACKTAIEEQLKILHSPAVSGPVIEHVSVFALAPIPLLMHLGRCLGNKTPATFYQRHRDTEDWKWKASGPPAEYQFKMIRRGRDSTRAALMISLSGSVSESQIPDDVLTSCSLYELSLKSEAPNTGFLRTVEDLDRFRSAYQSLLGQIRLDSPDVSEIHVFPAVPIPVALSCGRDLLEKAHPCLVVYDRNKQTDKFIYALRINQ